MTRVFLLEVINIFLLVPMLLLMLLIIFVLYKMAKTIGRNAAVFIDFLLIGGFTTYYLHHAVSVKIASANAVYFWDAIFLVASCAIYYILLKFISIQFPRTAKLLHYTMAWIGTYIIYMLLCTILVGDLPRLLNNNTLSIITNLVIISLFAILTFNVRKTMFIEAVN